MNVTRIAFAVALTLLPACAFAQIDQATIQQRKTDQQDRIAQGVRSGELSAGQTAHLEHQEAAINHEERAMKAQDNGHLTKQDKRTINHQQNVESRRIHRDKR